MDVVFGNGRIFRDGRSSILVIRRNFFHSDGSFRYLFSVRVRVILGRKWYGGRCIKVFGFPVFRFRVIGGPDIVVKVFRRI